MAPSNHTAVGAFMRTDPGVRRLLARADEALGYPVLERFRDAGTDYDESGRVAFVVNCLALAERAVERHGLRPELCVGPSFGQMAAMGHTGVLPFAELVRITAELAREEEACFAADARGLATHFFFRTPDGSLRRVLSRLEKEGTPHEVSCVLGGGFGAVTLPETAVPVLEALIREVRGVPLYSMRPPVHCSALAVLRERALKLISAAGPADPRIPLVSDLDGGLVTTGAAVAELVAEGFVRPVRWPDAVRTMLDLGIERVCVPGPSNLFDRLSRGDFEVLTASPEDR